MKKISILIGFLLLSLISFGQDVRIKNEVFEVLYSQSLEQPLIIKYRSTNRPTNVNRGAMDFYKESNIKTSDAADYKANIYDKGHGAPAATFSDNMINLKSIGISLIEISNKLELSYGIIKKWHNRSWEL
jgi:hypothetical protein